MGRRTWSGHGGFVRILPISTFQCYKPLRDGGVYLVLVQPGGDGVGLVGEVRATQAADDLGGGCGRFAAA